MAIIRPSDSYWLLALERFGLFRQIHGYVSIDSRSPLAYPDGKVRLIKDPVQLLHIRLAALSSPY